MCRDSAFFTVMHESITNNERLKDARTGIHVLCDMHTHLLMQCIPVSILLDIHCHYLNEFNNFGRLGKLSLLP